MRLLGPLSLTLAAGGILYSATYHPWGFLQTAWGGRIKGIEAWDHGLDSGKLFGVGTADIKHFIPIGFVCLVAVGGWLRAGKVLSVPLWLMILLSAYATYHTAWNVWFFASGTAVRLTGPRSLSCWPGMGSYLAVGSSLLSMMTCVVMAVWCRRAAPAASLVQDPAGL
jgi:hypothetical protein